MFMPSNDSVNFMLLWADLFFSIATCRFQPSAPKYCLNCEQAGKLAFVTIATCNIYCREFHITASLAADASVHLWAFDRHT
jgi:hypothetical protein